MTQRGIMYDVTRRVADDTGVAYRQVEAILASFCSIAAQEVKENGKFHWPPLVKFYSSRKVTAPRMTVDDGNRKFPKGTTKIKASPGYLMFPDNK